MKCVCTKLEASPFLAQFIALVPQGKQHQPTSSTQDRSGWPPDVRTIRLKLPAVPHWAPFCVLRKRLGREAGGTTVSYTYAELNALH